MIASTSTQSVRSSTAFTMRAMSAPSSFDTFFAETIGHRDIRRRARSRAGWPPSESPPRSRAGWCDRTRRTAPRLPPRPWRPSFLLRLLLSAMMSATVGSAHAAGKRMQRKGRRRGRGTATIDRGRLARHASFSSRDADATGAQRRLKIALIVDGDASAFNPAPGSLCAASADRRRECRGPRPSRRRSRAERGGDTSCRRARRHAARAPR